MTLKKRDEHHSNRCEGPVMCHYREGTRDGEIGMMEEQSGGCTVERPLQSPETVVESGSRLSLRAMSGSRSCSLKSG